MFDRIEIQPPNTPTGATGTVVVQRRVWPVATLTFLTLNFLFFGLEIYAGGFDKAQVLLDLGASYGPYLRRGEYWRLVMPIFLHGGWAHILGNSFVLYVLGPILERVYGYGRFATIYVISGMGGALLSASVSRNIAVGASGAVMGVAGAILIAGYVHRETIPTRWARALGARILPFILVVFASGFRNSEVDNWGHVGGLATGALLAFLIAPPQPEVAYGAIAEPPSQSIVALPILVVVLSIAGTANHYRAIRTMNRLLAEGERFESARQFDREFQSFQQALKAAPHEAAPHEELGNYYLTQKHFDQAIQQFQDAVRLSGGDDEIQLELGLAYELKGDHQKAQNIFEGVIGKNPRSPEARDLLAEIQVRLAGLDIDQQHYAEAINAYQQALRISPDLAVAHNNLAWLYATCDDPKFRDARDALAHAERAVELTNWKEGEFIDTLAEAYYANGDYKQAVEIQKKALALLPDNDELKEHMAKYKRATNI